MSNNSKIPYKYYHWGPFLFHSKITLAEGKMIINEGKKCRKKSNDYRAKLAGHLSEEYTLEDTKGIIKWFEKYLIAYTNGYNEWRGKWRGNSSNLMTNLHIEIFWINYMKSNDFNPPHDHSGDLSFVIYPHIPKEIIKENKEYKGSATGPGGIGWFYGEGNRQYIDTVNMMPQTGDIFIFPASLKHWVFPFRSNVERISVSGNISFGRQETHFLREKWNT